MVLKKTIKLLLALVMLALGAVLSPTNVEAASPASVTVQIIANGVDSTPVTLIGYQSRLGANGNKREFIDIAFSRAFDNNSQKLAAMSLSDATAEKVIFTFTRSAGQFLTITLYKARFSSVQDHTTAAADVPIEQVTAVALDKVEYSYKPLQRDGSLGAAVVTTWDVNSAKWR